MIKSSGAACITGSGFSSITTPPPALHATSLPIPSWLWHKRGSSLSLMPSSSSCPADILLPACHFLPKSYDRFIRKLVYSKYLYLNKISMFLIWDIIILKQISDQYETINTDLKNCRMKTYRTHKYSYCNHILWLHNFFWQLCT